MYVNPSGLSKQLFSNHAYLISTLYNYKYILISDISRVETDHIYLLRFFTKFKYLSRNEFGLNCMNP